MSLHDATFAAVAAPAAMDWFGDASRVTYTARGGTPVTLTAIVGRIRIEDRQTQSGIERVSVCDVKITNNPTGAYGGVASPQANATITIDTEPWAVESMQNTGAGLIVLTCTKREAGEVTRPRYYGDR